jgi:hypothetical protein
MIIFSSRKNRKHAVNGVMVLVLTFSFPSMGITKPTESKFSEVSDCQSLGKVEGSSGYGKNWGWQPLAKAATFNRAEKLGASHIVVEKMTPVGAFNGFIVASAYNCSHDR